MNAKAKNVIYGVVPRLAAVGLVWYKYSFIDALVLLLVIMAITNYIGYKIDSKA
jgi:hypothetical protein